MNTEGSSKCSDPERQTDGRRFKLGSKDRGGRPPPAWPLASGPLPAPPGPSGSSLRPDGPGGLHARPWEPSPTGSPFCFLYFQNECPPDSLLV